VQEQDIDDVAGSPTNLRESLLQGHVHTANQAVRYPFEFTGIVVRGDQIRREIGVPAAALTGDDPHKLIPAYGIYAVEDEIYCNMSAVHTGEYVVPQPDRIAKGMAYIGTRPTVDGMNRKIEINLLDFKDDIYSTTLRVKFLKFIRHDQWF